LSFLITHSLSEGEHDAHDQSAAQQNTASITQSVFGAARTVDAKNNTINVVAGAQHVFNYKDMDNGMKIAIGNYPSFNDDTRASGNRELAFAPQFQVDTGRNFSKSARRDWPMDA
jgi:hypothetical protein